MHRNSASKNSIGVIGNIKLHTPARVSLTKAAFYIVDKRQPTFSLEPASSARIPYVYYHKLIKNYNVSLTWFQYSRTTIAAVSFIITTAAEATPSRVTSAKSLVELRVTKQISLKPNGIRPVKVVFKGTGLL